MLRFANCSSKILKALSKTLRGISNDCAMSDYMIYKEFYYVPGIYWAY